MIKSVFWTILMTKSANGTHNKALSVIFKKLTMIDSNLTTD